MALEVSPARSPSLLTIARFSMEREWPTSRGLRLDSRVLCRAGGEEEERSHTPTTRPKHAVSYRSGMIGGPRTSGTGKVPRRCPVLIVDNDIPYISLLH